MEQFLTAYLNRHPGTTAAVYARYHLGSIAFRLALVAGGEGDGTLTFRSLREWDVCAGVAIVEQAGGIVIDGEGERLTFNRRDTFCRGMVASNPPLARSLHAILTKALAGKLEPEPPR